MNSSDFDYGSFVKTLNKSSKSKANMEELPVERISAEIQKRSDWAQRAKYVELEKSRQKEKEKLAEEIEKQKKASQKYVSPSGELLPSYLEGIKPIDFSKKRPVVRKINEAAKKSDDEKKSPSVTSVKKDSDEKTDRKIQTEENESSKKGTVKETAEKKTDEKIKTDGKKSERKRSKDKKSSALQIKSETSKADEKKNEAEEKKSVQVVKPKYSIGIKLILIISAIVSISLALITILVSYYVSADTRINAEENNLTINSRTASDTENRFSSVISSVLMFYDSLDNSKSLEVNNSNASKFYERNQDIAFMSFINEDLCFVNKPFFVSHQIDIELINSFILQEEEILQKVKNGDVYLENAFTFFNTPAIAVFTPVQSERRQDVAVILFSMESLSESYSTGSINLSFLVNSSGTVLIHPDLDKMQSAADFSEHETVKKMIENNQNNEQITYTDENGVEYISAYNKFSLGGCAVITEVKTDIVLEAVNATTRRNIYLTIAILSIAIMIIWFFSKSLSKPLKQLTEITNEINEGNFETHLLAEIKDTRKDEIGVLIKSTKAEQDILNTFTKLTNKGVTRAIVRKEIDFQPHLKDITIFFSDIRGFTAISDGFNKRFGERSAGEIIEFLNDYMGRMVNCITISGGNVDKFEGDAIMACWGVLRDDNLDFETLPDSDPEKLRLKEIHEAHVKQDAVNAIMATTAMRYSLMEYNKKAEAFTKEHADEPLAKYKPHIRIGSGLNSGRATVGFMGSYDKMEFTSIGDAVNLASRTESSNKPCGTDMLITEDTYNLLKMDFIRCPENNFTIREENLKNEVIVEVIPVTFEVKGKGKQHFYGVVNMPNFDIEEFFKKGDPDFKIDPDCAKAIGPEGPVTLAEVRELLGIPTPDFGGVNLDAEENKVTAS